MTTVESVERFLAELEERAPGIADSPEAAGLLGAARALDSDISATSRSMLTKSFNDTCGRLRELAPPNVAGDDVDALAARRRSRRAAA